MTRLETALHFAALHAQELIAGLPDDLDPVEECNQIDAASAPALAIAEEIADRSARARAWLDGSYWAS